MIIKYFVSTGLLYQSLIDLQECSQREPMPPDLGHPEFLVHSKPSPSLPINITTQYQSTHRSASHPFLYTTSWLDNSSDKKSSSNFLHLQGKLVNRFLKIFLNGNKCLGQIILMLYYFHYFFRREILTLCNFTIFLTPKW